MVLKRKKEDTFLYVYRNKYVYTILENFWVINGFVF